jgi:hypothetical protein
MRNLLGWISAALPSLACLLVPQTCWAGKAKDEVTVGSDQSISNNLLGAQEVAEWLSLQAGWTLLDSDSGPRNTALVGADWTIVEPFALTLQLNGSPRQDGVAQWGGSIAPSVELGSEDFITTLSFTFSFEANDVEQNAYANSVCAHRPNSLACRRLLPAIRANGGKKNALEEISFDQFAFSPAISQAIYDFNFDLALVFNRYTQTNSIGNLGREFSRSITQINFERIGGVLPSFPVSWELDLAARYKWSLGSTPGYALAPSVSWSHLLYEGAYGYGDVFAAKLGFTFLSDFTVYAGAQLMIDQQSGSSNATTPMPAISTVTFYGLLGFQYRWGGEAPVASAEADSENAQQDEDKPQEPLG